MFRRLLLALSAVSGMAFFWVSPAWAAGIQAGDACSPEAVGSTTLATNGQTLVCFNGGDNQTYQWQDITGQLYTGSSATGTGAGTGLSRTIPLRIPIGVETGSGGGADRVYSALPLAVGAAGLVLCGASGAVLVWRRRRQEPLEAFYGKRSPAGPAFGLAIGAGLLATAAFLPMPPEYRTPSATGTVPAVTNALPASAARGAGRPRRATGVPVAAKATSVPVQIDIPKLGVAASVVEEGIGSAGDLDIPDNPRVVGWWSGGARPGAVAGTTVVAGHVDTRRDGEGAFYHLEQLRPGDLVYVKARSGYTAAYRVVARQVYLKAALPTDLFTQYGGHRLALVTCGGPFDAATGSYLDNVVVYGLPV